MLAGTGAYDQNDPRVGWMTLNPMCPEGAWLPLRFFLRIPSGLVYASRIHPLGCCASGDAGLRDGSHEPLFFEEP